MLERSIEYMQSKLNSRLKDYEKKKQEAESQTKAVQNQIKNDKDTLKLKKEVNHLKELVENISNRFQTTHKELQKHKEAFETLKTSNNELKAKLKSINLQSLRVQFQNLTQNQPQATSKTFFKKKRGKTLSVKESLPKEQLQVIQEQEQVIKELKHQIQKTKTQIKEESYLKNQKTNQTVDYFNFFENCLLDLSNYYSQRSTQKGSNRVALAIKKKRINHRRHSSFPRYKTFVSPEVLYFKTTLQKFREVRIT